MNKGSITSPANQTINWNEIHNLMETSRQLLEENFAPSPEASRANLKARARLLAQEPQQADLLQEFLEIVEFRLAAETYGIESSFVREVYPLKQFTPLPGVPPFVLGIVNVRGQILSIIDLKKFFNLPEKGLDQLNKLIILRDKQMEFCILTDNILGVHSIALDTIRDAPLMVSGIGGEYLRGVTSEFVILLDAEKILNNEQIIVYQEET